MEVTWNRKKEFLRYLFWFIISIFLVWLSFILVTTFTTEIPFPEDYCIKWTSGGGRYCEQYKSKLVHAIVSVNHHLRVTEKHNWVYFGIFMVTVLISLGINVFLRKKSPLFFGIGRLRDAVTVQTIIFPLLLNIGLSFLGRKYYLNFVPKKIKELHNERVTEELEYCKWEVVNEAEYYENDPN